MVLILSNGYKSSRKRGKAGLITRSLNETVIKTLRLKINLYFFVLISIFEIHITKLIYTIWSGAMAQARFKSEEWHPSPNIFPRKRIEMVAGLRLDIILTFNWGNKRTMENLSEDGWQQDSEPVNLRS